MADDKAKDKAKDKELELEEPKKSKKMIIIIAAVVVLAAGGGGAFFFLGGNDKPAPVENSASASEGDTAGAVEESSSVDMGNAIYVPMPRPFRFNIPGTVRDRFVEIRVQLLVRSSDQEETAKKHIPLIESTLLGVFSQTNADDLATSVGKASLKQKALAAVQQEMKDVADEKIVEKVLFTGFVMQ
ncbi:MAG: flagellar basal body-associated protein FliL [Alteromonadaceae bacterium]|nr:flagellar basal body-associated protein FliL [Alteromonadaceae bacterium]